nr:prepilin-type N-terminal cleavage/methylation domain-containing protein [PVC group bacterium]
MNHKDKQHNAGFTLVELIVVIVIIAIIAGFSAMAYAKVAQGMRLSNAKNTVVAALDNARAIAIRSNRYVITVFRPRLVNDGTQQVMDIVIAEWVGDSNNAYFPDPYNTNEMIVWTYDRFVPVPSVQVRTLASGIGIAGPGYGTGDDSVWWAATYLPAVAVIPDNEPYGEMVGILYSPEGRVVVRNAESASDRIWVDFDRDGLQTIDPDPDRNGDGADAIVVNWAGEAMPFFAGNWVYFDLEGPGGESFIGMTFVLAIFEETACRASGDLNGEEYDLTKWPTAKF